MAMKLCIIVSMGEQYIKMQAPIWFEFRTKSPLVQARQCLENRRLKIGFGILLEFWPSITIQIIESLFLIITRLIVLISNKLSHFLELEQNIRMLEQREQSKQSLTGHAL